MSCFADIKLKAWHFVVALFSFTIILIIMKKTGLEEKADDSPDNYLVELDDNTISDAFVTQDSYVLFYTNDSGFCDKMKSNLNRFAEKKQNKATCFAVNLDEFPQQYKQFNISGVPSILVFKDGKEIKRILGVVPESNLEKIYKIINH